MGISHVSAQDPADLTMADRTYIDNGYAPELDEFDPGVRIFSRITPFLDVDPSQLAYVVRFDTMLVTANGRDLEVYKPHPLDVAWASRTGTSCLGNPTFGDNPRWRGEPSVGLVGNGFFGSKEYYQGPLSGKGVPGSTLGPSRDRRAGQPALHGHRRPHDAAGGRRQRSPEPLCRPGGRCHRHDPARSTGDDDPHLDRASWDLRPFAGRLCRLRIVDASTADPWGFINVDEIREVRDNPLTATPPAVPALRPRAVPNPFNPRTEIRFTLRRAGTGRSAHPRPAGPADLERRRQRPPRRPGGKRLGRPRPERACRGGGLVRLPDPGGRTPGGHGQAEPGPLT